MLNNLNIKDIVYDGYKSIKGNSSFLLFVLIYILSPIAIAAFVWCKHWSISNDITSDIIGGIGLFAGLMFTLLFVVTSNYKNRKEQLSSNQDDETVNYIERYRKFTENTVALISYSIIKAGIIIIITIFYASNNEVDNNHFFTLYQKILNGLLVIHLFQFMLVITRILNEMYAMLFDDINK